MYPQALHFSNGDNILTFERLRISWPLFIGMMRSRKLKAVRRPKARNRTLRYRGDSEKAITEKPEAFSPVRPEEPIGVEQAATQIACELHRLADPKRAALVQRYFAEPIQSLGIDGPTLRGVTKIWIRRAKRTWHLREACALCNRLFQFPDIETRSVGFLILGAFSSEFAPSLLARAERWLSRHLNNWALVDGFASTILSPLLRSNPNCTATLRRWAESECLWVRRAAVVTLVPFARRGEHLDLTFELVETLLGDQEDLMHKALGWLLREAGKTYPKRLKQFLLRHRGAIPRTTVRYAIERFPADERNQLLLQTRPRFHKQGVDCVRRCLQNGHSLLRRSWESRPQAVQARHRLKVRLQTKSRKRSKRH